MLDDGIGIPVALQDTIFEPRVTSKLETMVMDRWGVHGRGMALFSVRENVKEARVVASAPHKGAAVTVLADTARTHRTRGPVHVADRRTRRGRLART